MSLFPKEKDDSRAFDDVILQSSLSQPSLVIHRDPVKILALNSTATMA
jgi:hypothetical protein